MTYQVSIQRTYEIFYTVEAEDEEEAFEAVKELTLKDADDYDVMDNELLETNCIKDPYIDPRERHTDMYNYCLSWKDFA